MAGQLLLARQLGARRAPWLLPVPTPQLLLLLLLIFAGNVLAPSANYAHTGGNASGVVAEPSHQVSPPRPDAEHGSLGLFLRVGRGGALRLRSSMRRMRAAAWVAAWEDGNMGTAGASPTSPGEQTEDSRSSGSGSCQPWTVPIGEQCRYVRDECGDLAGSLVDFLYLHYCLLGAW